MSNAYDKTAITQPERAVEAQKLAEAYIEYDNVQELAEHIEAVLHLWEVKGFDLAEARYDQMLDTLIAAIRDNRNGVRTRLKTALKD